jgi:arylsulfatase A-like enzyme
MVTEQNTPVLWHLRQQGVVFQRHHPVYLSATNVNGVALATGMYPAHSGLIANHDFRPDIDPLKSVDVEDPKVVRRGDELTHGKYIASPTLAELVQKAGGRTAVAASKTVGLLHDRGATGAERNGSVTLSAGNTLPNEFVFAVTRALGAFPRGHLDRDAWTTRALTDLLWNDAVPAFSVLWLGEPDLTQHESAPGSPSALAAVRSSDHNLGAVMAALEAHHVRDSTDVVVVSDHGFSTIQRQVDLPNILAGAGFNVSTEFKQQPKPGEVMMVGGGGTVLFYVVQHDRPALQRLVEFLQKSDFAGVIFTREPIDGTFRLGDAQINSAAAPDAVMAFRWIDQPNQYGVRGMIDADWQRSAGKGTHATLSAFDMHNTMVAAGPDFRQGWADDLPSGNVDVAPTILELLGIARPVGMDGRVLTEALARGAAAPEKAVPSQAEADRGFPGGNWHQWLHTTSVGRTVYLDEGNGSFTPAR